MCWEMLLDEGCWESLVGDRGVGYRYVRVGVLGIGVLEWCWSGVGVGC